MRFGRKVPQALIICLISILLLLFRYSSYGTSLEPRLSVPSPSGQVSRQPTFVQSTPIQTDTVLSATDSAVLVAVVKVVDGDTITVSIDGKKETVRLIGINTPETVDPRKPVECFGTQASEFAKHLMQHTYVQLVSDSTQADRDRYQRLLRYVYLPDGTFVNKQMIDDGYAYEYTYDSHYQFQQEFKRAEQSAQAGKRGLWGEMGCPVRQE